MHTAEMDDHAQKNEMDDHAKKIEAFEHSEQGVQGNCKAKTTSTWAKKCPGKDEAACKRATQDCKWCGTFTFC